MSIPFDPAFIQRVEKDPFLGVDLLVALDTIPPVSVRFHPKKHIPNWIFFPKLAGAKIRFI